METERCYSCGRFKTANTGLICTNMRCKEGITVEQDWAEVDAIREGKKFISINPPVMLSFPSDELLESFYPVKFKLGETRAEQERKEKNIEIRKVIDWYKDLVVKANSERGNGA